MGSVGLTNREVIIPEMRQGDDYQKRKAQIDAKVSKIIDSDGIVVIGDENSDLFQTISINTQPESGKYQITEFVNGEPASHWVSNSPAEMLEKFFASHKQIKRYR